MRVQLQQNRTGNLPFGDEWGMTRYKLDEKTGLIWMLPGHSTHEEAMDVLGKALCMNTARLARAVGVPENEVYECKNGSVAAISHNLKKVDGVLGNDDTTGSR